MANPFLNVTSRDTVSIVDKVMLLLSNRAEDIVLRLFPGDAEHREAYRAGWVELDPFRFWCRLDEDNRRRVVRMAEEVYC